MRLSTAIGLHSLPLTLPLLVCCKINKSKINLQRKILKIIIKTLEIGKDSSPTPYVPKPLPRVKVTWSFEQVTIWFTPGSPPQCTFCPSQKKSSLEIMAKAFQCLCYNGKSMRRFEFYFQINNQLFPQLLFKKKSNQILWWDSNGKIHMKALFIWIKP